MALSRDGFAAAMSRRYELADIPGLGSVRLQSLTVREMSDIRASLRHPKTGEIDRERLGRIDALVVAAAIVDDDDVMRGFFDAMDAGPWACLTAAVKRHTGWDCGEDWTPVKAAAKN
mgnify:CR=1 FL=1